MLHPDPIESSPKGEPPPHPGDARNTKKVKLGDGEEMDILMDEDCSPSLAAETTLAPATMDSEMVPETQAPLPMSNAMETNVMSVDSHHDIGKIPSFKDKLLNTDKDNTEEEEEVVLKKGDVEIGMEGNIPTMNFAVHVLEALNQRMGLAVVVKLLGRQIGYAQLRIQLQNIWKPMGRFKLTDLDDDCFLVRFTEDINFQNALLNGPWVIFGYYLTVQPWLPSFKPQEHVINQVIGWIRLPRLPARYYHKSIIRSIGSVFGDVIRVDYNTESGDRGKFARLAVVIDLTKPLISKILVDGEVIYVEYEGLPLICFNCGRYGHLQEVCPEKMAQAAIVQSVILLERVQQEEGEQAQFGAWMQVPRRRQIYSRGGRKEADVGSKGIPTTSRYEALYEATT